MHLVYLKYEDRMKKAMPFFLMTKGQEVLNTFVAEFLAQHNQRYEKTCPDPLIPYKSGMYLNFRKNKMWNQIQSSVLGPFVKIMRHY